MRVLILGGTGFLGPQITGRLLAFSHEVTVFHRGATDANVHKGVDVIHGDRNRLDQSFEDLRRLRPDVIVDVIAFTQAQAESLVAAFRGYAGRLVVLSSGDVYRANDILFRRVEGDVDPTPLVESSPLRERLYPYLGMSIPQRYGFHWDAYEKILVERTVMRERSLPATALRLPMVYGPGSHDAAQRRFLTYLKRMEDGREAILLDERTARWRAPWGYTGDVSEAVRLAVASDQSVGEIFNVCESDGLDIRGWIQGLAAAAGWSGEVVTSNDPCPPPSFPRQLNLDQHLDMDTKKIRRELGYHETLSRREALEKTVAWDREHWPTEIDLAQFDYVAADVILSRASK